VASRPRRRTMDGSFGGTSAERSSVGVGRRPRHVPPCSPPASGENPPAGALLTEFLPGHSRVGRSFVPIPPSRLEGVPFRAGTGPGRATRSPDRQGHERSEMSRRRCPRRSERRRTGIEPGVERALDKSSSPIRLHKSLQVSGGLDMPSKPVRGRELPGTGYKGAASSQAGTGSVLCRTSSL
jgi:hypothetical protein